MKIIKFGLALNQDELEFQIPHEYTFKMISHLRTFRHWLGVQVHISPFENNQINRKCDNFFLHENGDEKKRAEIKKFIGEFCKTHDFEPPVWPENY